MNIAIIGSGGREHALYWKIKQSPKAEKVFVLPGNGGIEESINIAVDDFPAIHDFCKKEAVELLIVGPEVPLVKGITDYFKEHAQDISVFGPGKAGACLEGSKAYAKEFMLKHGVATAAYHKTSSKDEAFAIIDDYQGNCVLKYDGLAAGKGVYVCNGLAEAKAAVVDIHKQFGDTAEFIIEEKLIGDEISIIGITDSKSIKLLQPSQDHKQLMENDLGPNTGGMGAFTPVPWADQALMQQIESDIVEPTLRGLALESFDFVGVVYFGIMVTKDGPKVLEYNVRFGDPETEVILPALKSDLLELILASLNGRLESAACEYEDGYFVDVVLVSGGYPKSYNKGYAITGEDKVSPDTLVFHAGTKKEGDAVVTSGGRVINVVCRAESLDDAISAVYAETKKIEFTDSFCRSDIGRRNRIVKP